MVSSLSFRHGSHALSAMLLSLSAIPLVSASPLFKTRDSNATMVYSWDNITSSPDLIWTPCFDNFTCSRLTVPLDYSNTTAGTTSIAYINFPAANATSTVPVQDILINPGGPGGSGVDIVYAFAATLAEYIGPQYNIIGFDPRGVNLSGPSIDCFPGDPAAKTRLAETIGRPVNSRDPVSLAQEFAKAGAYGEWCSHVLKDGDAKYANTPAVAGDMLNYVEKAAVALGGKAEEAKLWYYGLSYGTALGATFASLFPDRIGRVLLDGVVDSEVYYRGSWDENIDQTDEAVSSFFTFCYAAGPEKCVFYANSTLAIKERMDAVIENIRKVPVPVSDPAFVDFPTIVTYEVLDFLLLSATYTPVLKFPVLAQVLLDLESRNGSLLAASAPPEAYSADNAGTLILCMDQAGRYNLSTEALWEEHVAKLNNRSSYVGDSWASLGLVCKDMQIFTPPSQQLSHTPSANQTSFPILFIGNTVDPVTPLKEAKKMSSLFNGSVVLEQNSVGHCSVSSFSKCTAGYIQRYFADGSLPAEGTVCQPEGLPFTGGTAVISG